MEASNWGSAIGEKGSAPSTLLFDMPGLMLDNGRGLALRMSAAVRSLWMLIALAERLKASISSSMTAGCFGGL